jgi:glycosyltransferase involved in cell wall biosynthesis
MGIEESPTPAPTQSVKLRELARRGRRKAGHIADRSAVRVSRPVRSYARLAPESGTSLAVVVVNSSTTDHLRLMLATLAGQEGLDALLTDVVVVDNGSRDGGRDFAQRLAAEVPKVSTVQNRVVLTHAHGMRSGLRCLDRLDRQRPDPADRPPLVAFVDSDVIFRQPDSLQIIVDALQREQGDFLGERRNHDGWPNAQASFLLYRRAVFANSAVAMMTHDGAPTAQNQQSMIDAGFRFVHLPLNHGGLILHRGYSGVAAAHKWHRRSSNAEVHNTSAHFMGVPDGHNIWERARSAHAHLLADDGALMAALRHQTEGG